MDNYSPLNPLAASIETLPAYLYKERNFSGAAAPGEIPGEIVYRVAKSLHSQSN